MYNMQQPDSLKKGLSAAFIMFLVVTTILASSIYFSKPTCKIFKDEASKYQECKRRNGL